MLISKSEICEHSVICKLFYFHVAGFKISLMNFKSVNSGTNIYNLEK